MNVLDKVKQLASEKGYSLLALNDKAKLGKNAIYKWKTQQPSTENLKKVADVLGVSVDYLLGDTNDMHANKKSTSDKPVDLKEIAENDNWDDYLSADGRPLTDHDKNLLRVIFGD